MPTKIIIVGEMTDIRLMQKVNEIMKAGYTVAFKQVMDPVKPALTPPVAPKALPPHQKKPIRNYNGKTAYNKYHNFHTADSLVLKFVQACHQAGKSTTIDEICLHLSTIDEGKGYAISTGATVVSKLCREGKLIRDENRNVVLA